MYPSLLNNIFPSINQAYPWPPKASEEKFSLKGMAVLSEMFSELFHDFIISKSFFNSAENNKLL